jgi:6-phosphogluconate dehydrogenase
MNNKAHWGIMGLGVMGTSLSRNLGRNGVSLALYNRNLKRSEEKVAEQRIQSYPELKNALAYEELVPFINAIETPRKLLLMLPAGEVTDHVLKELIPLLDRGDVVIDGGNSHYETTDKRAAHFKDIGIRFLGMGVSGGKEGALRGPSLMLGGDPDAYLLVEKDLQSIAAKNKKNDPCCGYVGRGGAGHFVKMVHNGIEYAEMQLIAEVFEIALSDPEISIQKLQKIFEEWQNTQSQNYLLSITSEILQYQENGVPFIELIEDKASNKGTGAWASSSGAQLGSPNSLMTAALHSRFTSFLKQERVSLAKHFDLPKRTQNISLTHLKKTYDLSRWINHHQGFEMIRVAANQYQWEIELSKIASLWSEGCIIKSSLMCQLIEDFTKFPNLLEIPTFKTLLNQGEKDWENLMVQSLKQHVSTPCISGAWNYFRAMTQENSSANLIQAQRDFFGRHGFHRVDLSDGLLHHGPWAK